ncbi:MAG: hypothetical protein HC872_03110 [Gammaproteobacteria bacterium]|nr:hypothetical protein [Gammaproteobacteria bacterium]
MLDIRRSSWLLLWMLSLVWSTQGEAAPLAAPERIWRSAIESTPLDSVASVNGEHIELVRDNLGNRILTRRRANGSLPSFNTSVIGNWGDSIGVDRAGRVAVVGEIPGSVGIYLRVFDSTGLVAVATRRVDEDSVGQIFGAKVGVNADGLIVVTWVQLYNDNTSFIRLRTYTPAGVPLVNPVLISQGLTGFHTVYDIAVDRFGNATLVGMRLPSFAKIDVWARRYNSAGTAIGPERQLNSSGADSRLPHVAVSPSGEAVAVWGEFRDAATLFVLVGQRFDRTGAPAGSNFIVSDAPNNDQLSDVGMMDDGSFVAVWSNRGRSGSPMIPPTILGREYRSDGTMVSAFKVATGVSAGIVAVSMDLAGGFIVMWRTSDPAIGYVAMGRRFAMDSLLPIVQLQDAMPVTNISSSGSGRRLYKFSNPEGKARLTISMMGDGDADLVIRYAALPTPTDFDLYPAIPGSNEEISIANPPLGDFYIEVKEYVPFSNVSLVVAARDTGVGGGGGGEPSPVEQ